MKIKPKVPKRRRKRRRAEGPNDVAMGAERIHALENTTNRRGVNDKVSFEPTVEFPKADALEESGVYVLGIGRRIRAAREARGWSQSRLATAIGKTQGAVSLWERDEREPTREDVARIAASLGFDVTELESPNKEILTVPVVGYVSAGGALSLYSDGQGPFEEVAAPEGATVKTVGVIIRGECWGPLFDGWIAFYDDVRRPVTDDLAGTLCVVGLPDGRVLIKKLQRSKSPGLWHLFSQYDEPLLDQRVSWAARVTSITPR